MIGREQTVQLFTRLGLIAVLLPWMIAADMPPQAETGHGKVIVLTVDGAIGPVISEYVLQGLQQAEEEAAQLVVIKLDTPGGLVETTRDIVKGILASSVPVAVYVTPHGARAASAGTYMLYAAHIAAMAPATTVGSATPVQMGGFPDMPEKPKTVPGDGETEKEQPGSGDKNAGDASGPDGQSTMERKVINYAAAYIRSLAKLRGRNAEWAEKAVREAVDLTASEALEQNVTDLIAVNIGELLTAIDGRVVKVDKHEVTLHTRSAQVEYLEPGWRTKFLTVITDPNIFFILMLLAFYGLLWEFIHPGMFLPGIVGAISLLLLLYASQILPVNYAGVAMIILGIFLMVAEAFAPSFGILGIGGIVAFTVGSIMLFNKEGYSISLSMIIGNAILSAVFLIWMLGMVFRIRRRPNVSGKETLVGATAEATFDFDREGYVRIFGESWKAVSESPVQKGQKLRIKSVDGLTVKVEPKNL